MASELIIAGTASEIEDTLLTSFRGAASKGDYVGVAALAKEMRKREEAAEKKKRRTEKDKNPEPRDIFSTGTSPG